MKKFFEDVGLKASAFKSSKANSFWYGRGELLLFGSFILLSFVMISCLMVSTFWGCLSILLFCCCILGVGDAPLLYFGLWRSLELGLVPLKVLVCMNLVVFIDNLVCMTWNVRGLGRSSKHCEVLKVIGASKPHILYLREVCLPTLSTFSLRNLCLPNLSKFLYTPLLAWAVVFSLLGTHTLFWAWSLTRVLSTLQSFSLGSSPISLLFSVGFITPVVTTSLPFLILGRSVGFLSFSKLTYQYLDPWGDLNATLLGDERVNCSGNSIANNSLSTLVEDC